MKERLSSKRILIRVLDEITFAGMACAEGIGREAVTTPVRQAARHGDCRWVGGTGGVCGRGQFASDERRQGECA